MSAFPKLKSQEASSDRFPNNLPAGWRELLKGEAEQDYFKKLGAFLNSEYRSRRVIYPARDNILRALKLVDYDNVEVVILGQDPYHGPDQAVGLCFAVPNELRLKPPSLQNIFKEIKTDFKVELNKTESDLTGWAKQGVLLLNTVLTVRAREAFSHREKGWEVFTDKIISLLNQRKKPIVFMLWGAAAHKKAALLTNKDHFILRAAHPSPLSAHKGFFGAKPFSQTNRILRDLDFPEINWQNISA